VISRAAARGLSSGIFRHLPLMSLIRGKLEMRLLERARGFESHPLRTGLCRRYSAEPFLCSEISERAGEGSIMERG